MFIFFYVESPDRSQRSGANTARSQHTARSGVITARSQDSVQHSLEGENYLLRSRTEQLESEVVSLKQVTSALEHGGISLNCTVFINLYFFSLVV